MSFIVITLALCLLFVFLQDLKYRHIHVVLPLLIFSMSIYIFYQKQFITVKVVLVNIIFLLLTLTLLVLYMSIKNKAFLNPFANYFGIGDLLFFIAITPLFYTYNFILVFIFSMIFSALLQVTFGKLMKIKSVPLAGFSALFLLLVIVKDLLFNFNKITIVG